MAAELDVQVHSLVCQIAEGAAFTLTSLNEKDGLGRWFVPAQNFHAISRRYDVLERGWKALLPFWYGGWHLVDELPDTDDLSGIPMSADTFTSRWQETPELVLKHLLKTRGGIG